MKNIVALDIETTGTDCFLDEICQMSYIILDRNYNIIKSKNFFFMVDYVQFKSNKNKLNIEELKVLSNNKTFKDRYEEIFNDLNNNLIVCHNCNHDINFLKSEFTRINNEKEFIYEEFCTMKYYTNILKIPSESFIYKYPKLTEVLPYLNIKRGDIHRKSKEIFNLSDSEIDFHDSRVDSVTTYLIAINTQALIDTYTNLLDNQKVLSNEVILIENNREVTTENIEKLNKNVDYECRCKNNIIKDLLSFKGKITRKKYIAYLLLIISIYFMVAKVIEYNLIISGEADYYNLNNLNRGLTILMYVTLIPISIKRLRDINQPLWLIIILFMDFFNVFLFIDLCISKGYNIDYNNLRRINNNKKNKIVNKSKPIIIITLSILMPLIILIGLFILLSISTINDKRESEAIDIVRYTLHHNPEPYTRTIDTYVKQMVEEIDPYYIDDWYAYEIEDNIYLVTFDIDREDDNYKNGYSSYPYEVNLDTKEVIEISSDEMIKKYEELGYFDDEIYINEFK